MRVFEVFDTPTEVLEKSDARELEAAKGEVRFEHVNFRYEKDHAVLHDIVLHAAPGRTTLSWLRETRALTGTKEGCGEGECGACTVLLDDEPVLSCLVPVLQCAGRRVTTVEGIEHDGLTGVQRMLVEHSSFQCGFCAPGIVLAVAELIESFRPGWRNLIGLSRD